MAVPDKGSEAERQIWKRWARSTGLTDDSGRFIFTKVVERRSRFRHGLEKNDMSLINFIEKTLIDSVHMRNAMVERWPETIRVMLNRTGGNDQGTQAGPFESWFGPPGLQKRMQSTRVWTDLIQFFVLEYHINNMTWTSPTSLTMEDESGFLPSMGFVISEGDELPDDIMDIVEDGSFGVLGLDNMKHSIHHLCLSIVMQENATPKNNPLLFWVGLCLQTEEFGIQERLEFGGLKDELTMREKLEALIHYARVFILDHAYMSWHHSDSVADEWKTAIETTFNSKSWSWIDRGLSRPIDQQGDPPDFSEPHWQAFKIYFESLHNKWLVKGSNSPIGKILELLQEHDERMV